MLFTGKVLSEDIGLIYFGARWYDPEVGRFITVDPAEDGGNWYAYCRNNPINAIDPGGEYTIYRAAFRNAGGMIHGITRKFYTGKIKFMVIMKFSDPASVLAKYGIGLIATKKIKAAILASDLIQNLLIKGDFQEAIKIIAGELSEDLSNLLTAAELFESLQDIAIFNKFERRFGKNSTYKYYDPWDLKLKMGHILKGKELSKFHYKLVTADFYTWWEKAWWKNYEYEDWFCYSDFDWNSIP